ncbi:hypothetical protein HPB52_018283 [Rhipicephalus sanguineus]|uniref:Uncharacterized protein n=1 Tax=Rhipicephalus sanguineus TaxID=34632 RepID=A0A9D4Q1L7_RHISA|nr:hypothetical protein HPB52_018283 [Rhipicephalus sanguineus]
MEVIDVGFTFRSSHHTEGSSKLLSVKQEELKLLYDNATVLIQAPDEPTTITGGECLRHLRGKAYGRGGFMPPDSQQDTPQRKFASRHDNVVPCTIAQIHMMGQDTLTIGDLEVQYVSLVGLVTSVDQQSTRVNFTLDDRTGPPIEGLIFAQEEASL